MENNKKGNVIIIILIVFVMLLAGFIVYDKFIKEDDTLLVNSSNLDGKGCPKCDEIKDNNSNSESCQVCEKCENKNNSGTFVANLKKSLSSLKGAGVSESKEKIDAFLSSITFDNYGIGYVELDIDGSLKIGFNDDDMGKNYAKKYGKEYVVAKNVVMIGLEQVGQDCSWFIWFIDENGQFKYIEPNWEKEDLLEIKNTKLSNVVNVIVVDYGADGSFVPVAILSDGTYQRIS